MDKIERIRRLKQARQDATDANKKEVVMERRQKRLEQNEIIKIDEEGPKKSDKLDKTIEQIEAKQSAQKQAFENYSQVAAQTYNKEIAGIEVDKQKYQQEKNKTATVVDDHRPTDEAKKLLSIQMRENDNRKRKRKNKDDTDSYINQKNRDFNSKLNRQYGKLE